MANHHDQPNTKLLIDAEKDNAFFALEATRPILIGKEITMIAYRNGLETSVELLLNYGFVPQANQVDALMLKKGGKGVTSNLDFPCLMSAIHLMQERMHSREQSMWQIAAPLETIPVGWPGH